MVVSQLCDLLTIINDYAKILMDCFPDYWEV